MKFISTIAALAALATALPTAVDTVTVEEVLSWKLLAERSSQLDERASSNVRNELQSGGTCPQVIFIFARGSTEDGNMVRTLVPSITKISH